MGKIRPKSMTYDPEVSYRDNPLRLAAAMDARIHAMTETSPAGLRTSTRESVRLLTVDRPERLNALSVALMEELGDAFLDAAADPAIRAIVVTGTGDRAFCSGFDLKDVHRGDANGERFRGPMEQARRLLFEIVQETWKPTIAAINGLALGAGLWNSPWLATCATPSRTPASACRKRRSAWGRCMARWCCRASFLPPSRWR